MAKEGSSHKTMVDAFSKRLRDLYPEPAHKYSDLFGSVVKPVSLKPDVYIKHPDGREWAFEMVHHNRHVDHLLKNHQRYVKAGIYDTWILWDDLRPKTGYEPSPDQGLLLPFVDVSTRLPANQATACHFTNAER